MSKQHKLAVVIGRFQPFHNQHAELILAAASVADNVVVLVGGDQAPRTPKNPFTAEERANMILQWSYTARPVPEDWAGDVYVVPIRNFMYSDSTWAQNVQSVVSSVRVDVAGPDSSDADVIVVGCNKDESSFYLKMFPQWALHEEPYKEHIDATQIRELLYDDRSLDFLKGAVPQSTLDFLTEFKQTEEFAYVLNERTIINKYKKSWESAPYAPTFVTADAVVICSGHILLVKRGAAPGQGLLALPGGFLDQRERLEDAAIRELREETRIKVPAPVLKGSVRETKVFDHPDRSSRGRTITHVSLIVLRDGPLPTVKGSDDAAWAGWVPLSNIDSSNMFEDHYDIVEYFKGRV